MKARWYKGWNIVGVCLVFQALIIGSVFFSYTLWVGEWLADQSLEVSLTYVMVPITTLTLCQAVVAPMVGYAMDRYSIRAMICIGTALVSLGYISISYATAFWEIILIYGTLIVAGVSLAGPLAAQTLAARWFIDKRGLAIGLSTTGTSIGGVIMAPTVTLLYESVGWRDAHFVLGVVFCLLIIPLVWFVVSNGPDLVNPDDTDSNSLEPNLGKMKEKIWTVQEILRQPNFWIIVLSFLPLITVFGSIQQHLRPFAADLGVSSMQAAFLVSVFASVMILGKIFFGLMADRYDHRFLFSISLSACVFVVFGFLTQSSYAGVLFFSGVLGFSAGGFLPLLGAIIASRFGAMSFGTVMGLLGPFLAISAFGPMLFSKMYELQGNYTIALWSALFVLVPGFLAVLFLKRN